MKMTFYLKLAIDGIKKNKRLYIPYLLTGILLVMMHYIISFLSTAEILDYMKGGNTLHLILPFGSNVIGAFSLIFLFYSHSILIRQRNKEFGLYNILGMDKNNLGRIMLCENLLLAATAILGGLIFGIALSKLAELGLLNVLKQEITYSFRIDIVSAGKTSMLFLCIYAILLIHSVIKVRLNNPLRLLQSANLGEKPPKANWFVALLGVLLLGGAYYIALSIKQPLLAFTLFFVAVLMVIAATYLLFISGSVAFCRLLQKNKRYYYKANHFVSVSSMVYRMKRNGASLASICILVTMVLVILSSTLSLYIGAEESYNYRYPSSIGMRLNIPNQKNFTDENFSKMRKKIQETVSNQKNVMEYSCIEFAGLFTDEGIILDQNVISEFYIYHYNNVGGLQILSLDEYNRIMGTNETLKKDECFIHCLRTEYSGDTFAIGNQSPLRVKSVIENVYTSSYTAMSAIPTIILVTADFENIVKYVMSITDKLGASPLYWCYNFDMDADAQAQIDAYHRLLEQKNRYVIPDKEGIYSYYIYCRENERSDFFSLYGGLFFVGILLEIVFLFAAILIIYYKQISEGFEDQKRFEVMQKVGMTKRDIRKSINSQILTVFFLPLLFAGLHLAFAFPIIWKLLQLFNLTNLTLIICVTIASFLLFALIYAIVYKITSNTYYSIVSGKGLSH